MGAALGAWICPFVDICEVMRASMLSYQYWHHSLLKCSCHHRCHHDHCRDDRHDDIGDDFESLYKGEISKSGTPILPSKRARKTPEKIQVSKDDLAELSETVKPEVETSISEETQTEEDVSLDQVSEAEDQSSESLVEDPENN